MYCYRITKYNPVFRNKAGAYLKNEWTSYSDIEKSFDNLILSPEKYLQTENVYVEAISFFMKFLDVNSLIIKGLEKHNAPEEKDYFYSFEMLKVYNALENNESVDKKTILMITRLCLRDNIWCKLKSDKMFVHFGYDYYMYIGSKKQLTINITKQIEGLGLFIEELESSPHAHQY